MKKLFLIGVILLLTGCNVNYELDINKLTITENIAIISENEDDNYNITYGDTVIESYIDSPVNSETNEKIPGVEYYKVTKDLNKDLKEMYINYQFPFNNFENSNIANHTISHFIISNLESDLTFSTSSYFKVFDQYEELNNLKIIVNITDDYSVVSSNADSMEYKTLIWNINRSNYKNKVISFILRNSTGEDAPEDPTPDIPPEIEQNPNENEEIIINVDNKNTKKNNIYYILIVLIPILLFIIVITLVINFKKRKGEK